MRIPSLAFLILALVLPLRWQEFEFVHPELSRPTIETEHFLVHFHQGAERTAREVARAGRWSTRRSPVFGNPHSSNPTSLASTQLVEHTREYILKFFNADPEEYLAIFPSNASGALKLVGESYPFPNGHYLLTFDNHNSVNGIREFAHARGAEVKYIPIGLPDMRVDEATLRQELSQPATRGHNLFAYPAQSHFSSVQHPLEWIEMAHRHGWGVLLDAAAFVPTSRLDLSAVKPDFVPVSFYKMFGYPTGLGALVARKQALAKLHRPWFAGGTITVASVQGDRYYLG